jgi:hypothetical protein
MAVVTLTIATRLGKFHEKNKGFGRAPRAQNPYFSEFENFARFCSAMLTIAM